MSQMLETPEFKNEEEEAKWWFDNRGLVLKEFEKAAADGTLGRGTLMKRGLTPTTTIASNRKTLGWHVRRPSNVA